MDRHPNSQFGYSETSCVSKFDCCFSSAIPFDNFTGMPNKEPRVVNFSSLCCLLCLWCELSTFFSVIDHNYKSHTGAKNVLWGRLHTHVIQQTKDHNAKFNRNQANGSQQYHVHGLVDVLIISSGAWF